MTTTRGKAVGRRSVEDVEPVDRPEPAAVRLTTSHFNRHAATVQAGRGEREVAVDQSRLQVAGGKRGPVGEQFLVDGPDRGPSGGDVAGRKGQHRVRLVQGGQAAGIARVGPLDEEPGQVIRLNRWLALLVGGHQYTSRLGSTTVRMPAGYDKGPARGWFQVTAVQDDSELA